jgi:hypothetical protein
MSWHYHGRNPEPTYIQTKAASLGYTSDPQGVSRNFKLTATTPGNIMTEGVMTAEIYTDKAN